MRDTEREKTERERLFFTARLHDNLKIVCPQMTTIDLQSDILSRSEGFKVGGSVNGSGKKYYISYEREITSESLSVCDLVKEIQ